MPLWVIRSSDNLFLRDKGGEALAVGESQVTIVGTPDRRLERYDVSSPTSRRAATAQEIADYDAEQLSAQSLISSHKKDLLATLAVIVRAKNTPAWNAMTTQQKVDATLAEASVWKSIREFIDDKV